MDSENSTSASRLLGAILMVAGCCIGAGMLGLPLVTASAGFLPTCLLFFICWLFMALTGLALLEVNLWFGTKVNLITLSQQTLGSWAKIFVGLLFVFLFYCLMVAYLAAGGNLVGEFVHSLFKVDIFPYFGSALLAAVFGIVIFLGSQEVDIVNRLLMIGLGVSYVILINLGLPHMNWGNFLHSEWSYALPALPTMVISFGYHNLVPSLTTYLHGRVQHLRIAILLGSALPLVIYLLWDGMILGILPTGEVPQGAMVTTLLREAVGGAFVADILEWFSFFALVTSFVTVGLSFVDFLSDGLQVQKDVKGSLLLVLLVLAPPFIFSVLYPQIFLTALNYAGAFGAVILFGIVPVLMVWKGRYCDQREGERLVPGGKVGLFCLGAFALMIFIMQLKSELGL